MNTRIRRSRRCLAALGIGTVAAAALPVGLAGAQAATGLEPVVVTAGKREVNLQDAPVAISAISGADFDRSNIVRLDNFNGYVPGLTIAKNDGAGRVVAIRGVGWETAQNLSTQPSVLVYMNGAYVANPLAMGTDLGELERVEVFRGPQGTEFGQGTTGGAINLILKKPELGRFGGDVDLGYGEYNEIRARGALNIPLGETTALRASLQKYSHDGFSEIKGGALDGYELDDADSWTGTASFLWQPSDSVTVNLTAFLQDSDQHAAAQKNVDDPISDPRKLTQDYPGIFKLTNNVYSAAIDWQSPSGVVFKSLTGFQELVKKQSEDGDHLTEDVFALDVLGFFVTTANWDVLPFWDNDSRAFSQEFSATYKGDKVDWVGGVYYLDHENFNYFLEATAPAPYSDWEDELADPGPDTLPPFASALNFVEARTVTRKDKAAYAQVTIHSSDRLAFTLGGRYQDEDQTDVARQFWNCLGGPCPTRQKTNDSKFTWKAGVDFDLSDSNLLYFLASTGWKNGGTNPGALGGAIQVPIEYRPEEVTAYEIGSKNEFADGRARFNIVGFYYDYENLQFMQEDPVPFAGGTGNIPKTDIYGIETEFGWRFNDEWRLDGHLTWMDGEFKKDFFTLDPVDFREGLAPGVGLFTGPGFALRLDLAQNTNLNGNTPPKLVDVAARLALTNTHGFAGGATLDSRLEWIYRGEYQYRVFNNPLVDSVPAYDVFNLFFNYRPAGSSLDLWLSATNLLDENGVNSRFSNPFGVLQTSEEFIPPRQVAVGVRYAF